MALMNAVVYTVQIPCDILNFFLSKITVLLITYESTTLPPGTLIGLRSYTSPVKCNHWSVDPITESALNRLN